MIKVQNCNNNYFFNPKKTNSEDDIYSIVLVFDVVIYWYRAG